MAIPIEVIEDILARFFLHLSESEIQDHVRLLLHTEIAHWFYTDHLQPVSENLPTLKLGPFFKCIFANFPIAREHISDFDLCNARFRDYKGQIPSCGCYLLNHDMTKVLLAQPPYQSDWEFPKGKIDQNETFMECAKREIFEEIGYDIDIASSGVSDENSHVFNHSAKEIAVFFVRDVDEQFPFVTHTIGEVANIAWFSISTSSSRLQFSEFANFDNKLTEEPENIKFNSTVTATLSYLVKWIKYQREATLQSNDRWSQAAHWMDMSSENDDDSAVNAKGKFMSMLMQDA